MYEKCKYSQLHTPHRTLQDTRVCFSFIGLTAVCRRKKLDSKFISYFLLTIKRNCWTEIKTIKSTTHTQYEPISSDSWLPILGTPTSYCNLIVQTLFIYLTQVTDNFPFTIFNWLVTVSAVSIQLFLFLITYRMHNIQRLQIHILQLTDLLLLSFVDAVDCYLVFHLPTFG